MSRRVRTATSRPSTDVVRNIPSWLAVTPRGALEQLKRSRSAPAERRVIRRIQRIAKQQPVSLGRRPGWAQGGLIEFVQMVKHGSTSRSPRVQQLMLHRKLKW